MADLSDKLDHAIKAVQKLRKQLNAGANRQVRSAEETTFAKATAMAWFKNYRPKAPPLGLSTEFESVDQCFTELLELTDRNSTRSRYLDTLKSAKDQLVSLRSAAVLVANSADAPERPSFGALVHDPGMLKILDRRWDETIICIEGGAHLAATVMMGGLLEALLLARVNRLQDKKPVFTAVSAPRDSSGKTKKQKEWTLKNYLDVAHELGWIKQSGKQVGEVLRDYRNYVHPAKEHSHGVELSSADSKLFLMIVCSLADQLVDGV